eukprot:7856412-Pyramimonas_sp.AAC.3
MQEPRVYSHDEPIGMHITSTKRPARRTWSTYFSAALRSSGSTSKACAARSAASTSSAPPALPSMAAASASCSVGGQTIGPS